VTSQSKHVRLVAMREWRQGVSSKAFRIITAVMVLATIGGVLIPHFVGGGNETATVGVVGATSSGAEGAARLAGKFSGADAVKLKKLNGLTEARAALNAGTVDVVLVDEHYVLLERLPAEGVSTSGADLGNALARVVGVNQALGAMPPGKRQLLSDGFTLPIRGVKPPRSPLASRIAGMAAAFVIYMFTLIYGQRVAEGVAEEKSSRVIEVLLSAVKPVPLLLGKVLGISAVSFTQALAVVAAFVPCALIAGNGILTGDVGQVVLVGLTFLIVGFALYAISYAAAGSLVSRQSEVGSVTTVMVLPLIITFAISFGPLFSEPSTLFTVLAYVPLTAPVAMPVLFAIGGASWLDVAISAVILVVTVIAVFPVAAQVYRRSILRMGGRVKLGDVLGRKALDV
jgi:ABC-2 type transport system permease protein